MWGNGDRDRLPTGTPARRSPQNRESLSLNRRLFREMVRGEVDDGPLSWLRRRTLVRFAVRLGMDSFEARLIIRAVEYECGVVKPASMADVETPIDTGYIASSRQMNDTSIVQLVILAVLTALILGFWLIGRES